MTKKDLVRTFAIYLQQELETLTAAAKATYEAATNEESKPENEYDTRALEASYLAGAQAKRVGEIREVLNQFQTLEFKDFTREDKLSSTAIAEVAIDGKKSTVFLMPKGGGVSLNVEGKSIQIVTPTSLLGEAIFGLKAGEEAEFEVGDRIRICRVLDVK